MYIIYSLIDPRTNEVRYVGRTSLKRKNKRLYEHINYAHKNKTYSATWIRKLLELNLLPIMEVLEEVPNIEESESREVYWISKFDNLTNLTLGGEKAFKFSKDVIEKLRIINTGENNPCFGKVWTEEERKRLSDSRKGSKHTQSHKDKIGESLSKRVSINGVIYKSIRYACKELHISNRTAIMKLRSTDYPDWIYI